MTIEQLEPLAEKIFWAIQEHGDTTGEYEVVQDMFRYDEGAGMGDGILIEIDWEEETGQGHSEMMLALNGKLHKDSNHVSFRKSGEAHYWVKDTHPTFQTMLVIADNIIKANTIVTGMPKGFDAFYDTQ